MPSVAPLRVRPGSTRRSVERVKKNSIAVLPLLSGPVLRPGAETARVMIIIITDVIGLGGFAHIIAGSIAAFYALLEGDATIGMFFIRFFLPALTGNIVGEVALFINRYYLTYKSL
ncbi:MAG: hypothetical protein PVH37_24110 [Desulfobacterales bacterium]